MRNQRLDTHWLFVALAQPGLRAADRLGQAKSRSGSKEKTKMTAGVLAKLRDAHKIWVGSGLGPNMTLPQAPLDPTVLSTSRMEAQ